MKEVQPDILVCSSHYYKDLRDRNSFILQFCASMWTAEQADEIQSIAKTLKPGIVTHAIPNGLQVEQGPDAIVEHLKATVPQLLQAHLSAK